jgi:L-iditol 2-dehydrogenase
MRGIVFKGHRQLEVAHFEDPTPGYGEAVIEMKASGMCGSDLHFYRNDPGQMIKEMGLTGDVSRPIIAGHEPCGTIAAVGPGVDTRQFKVGDRVIVFHYVGCKHCDHCRTGWEQMCDHGSDVRGFIGHGGHAHYMQIPVTNLVHLPEEMSFVGGAAVACGSGTAYNALVRLNASARDTLAVFGLGPVGLSAVQFAAAMGLEVIGVDINPQRAAAALRFGATHVIDASQADPVERIHALTRGKGVSLAIDAAGGEVPKQQAVRSTAQWGKIALVAVGGDLTVDAMRDLIGKQRTVFGSWTFSNVGMKNCAGFIADHGIDVDQIFTHRWQLDQASEAYRSFDEQKSGKGVFIF